MITRNVIGPVIVLSEVLLNWTLSASLFAEFNHSEDLNSSLTGFGSRRDTAHRSR
jgi:hypothetical protein